MNTSILLIDNYDSFVYNLARYFEELGCRTQVLRNDAATVDEIRDHDPSAIVLSPGPCTPRQAGVCVEVVRQLGESVPILGVCLGHQAIAAAFGGDIVREVPVHGRTSTVWHDGQGLFAGLENPLSAARYHSLVASESTLPASLDVTALTADGVVMALQHREQPIYGVQFHPESILTDSGHALLSNFLKLAGLAVGRPTAPERPSSPADEDFFARSIEQDHPPPWPSGVR